MRERVDRSLSGAGELVSLFCGAGGLDLGFEKAGLRVMVAVDVREPSIDSYNHNRQSRVVGHVADVSVLSLAKLDRLAGRRLDPVGVIGGPPCQSFSRAAHSGDDVHRHELPLEFARLLNGFNRRSPVKFFVFENVPGLVKNKHKTRYKSIVNAFGKAGFSVHAELLNASSFGVAQDQPG